MKVKIRRRITPTIVLGIMIVLSIFAHYIKFVSKQSSYIFSLNSISWIICFVYVNYCIISDMNKIKNSNLINAKFFLIFILFCFSMAFSFTINVLEQNYIAQIIVLISFFSSLCFKWSKRISEKDIITLGHMTIFLGVTAAMYAIFNQSQYILNIISRNNTYTSAWNIYSFFGQRNVFAGFCFLALINDLYIWGKVKRKTIYILIASILVISIILTDSRAAMLATAIFCLLFYYFAFVKKNIYKIITVVLVFALIVAYVFGLFDQFDMILHPTISGVDSSTIRLRIWSDGIQNLIDKKAILFGLGEATMGTFLLDKYGFASFHNAYIDILYQGGIIRLSIYMISMIYLFQVIRKSRDDVYRNTFLAGFIAYTIYNMFESGALLLTYNYFSVLTTIMFAIMPMAYYSGRNNFKTMRNWIM